MYYLGIDVGSVTTKAVLLDIGCNIVASNVVKTGAVVKNAVDGVCAGVFKKTGIVFDDVSYTVATGYGRKSIDFADKSLTEITTHARGAKALFADTSLIIDIGGQDTKVILLSDADQVDDFVMNDKCAAGTGRFLEVMAQLLDLPVNQFGERALSHTKDLKINSTCTVFAESEVISLISKEESIADIAFAIHASVVDRVIGLTQKIPLFKQVTLTGGVSKNIAIREIISNKMNVAVNVPENPQIVGALGAAYLAHSYSRN